MDMITIPEEEFKRLTNQIRVGQLKPQNTAATTLARIALDTLKAYDLSEPYFKE